MAQLIKQVTEVEVAEALPPAQYAKLTGATAKGTEQIYVGNQEQPWDDGVHEHVRKIIARVEKCDHSLISIQFHYLESDGTEVICPRHGGPGGDEKKFELGKGEDVTKVYATYDPTGTFIWALTFQTNRRTFNTLLGEVPGGAPGQKIVGFQGTANGARLCKIRAHKENSVQI